MDWIVNVIVSALTIIVYISIFGFIAFVIGRFLYRFWYQSFKFTLRYKIFRKEYDEIMVRECYDAIDLNWTLNDFKTHLLISGFTIDEIYDVLYVYNTIRKELGIFDQKPVHDLINYSEQMKIKNIKPNERRKK